MKTFEFTEDACKLLEQCIKHRIDYLHSNNECYVEMRSKGIWGDEVVKAYNANCDKIGELKTLLNYINS